MGRSTEPGGVRCVFVSWGAVAGRPQELAAETGAAVLSCFPPGEAERPPALVRYAAGAITTVRYLLRHRPATVVVTNPPIIPVAIAVLYALAARATLIIDDHPGGFGAMGYRPAAYTGPLHRLAVRRARLCLVAADAWRRTVTEWGGRALVLHEAPGGLEAVPYRPCRDVPRVLFVSTFARDEPAAAMIEAAGLMPEVQVDVTGDPARRPAVDLPPNVRLVGFLDEAGYKAALADADVIVALTTEATSAMRAAFEAVWVAKPLVLSDWPLLRELFPEAVHVANTAPDLARGVRAAVTCHRELAAASSRMRVAQAARWQDQLRQLRSAMEGSQLC